MLYLSSVKPSGVSKLRNSLCDWVRRWLFGLFYNLATVFFIRIASKFFCELIEIVLENYFVSKAVHPLLLWTKFMFFLVRLL